MGTKVCVVCQDRFFFDFFLGGGGDEDLVCSYWVMIGAHHISPCSTTAAATVRSAVRRLREMAEV